MDSPPTALGNSGYQSAEDLLEVKISDRPGGRPATAVAGLGPDSRAWADVAGTKLSSG